MQQRLAVRHHGHRAAALAPARRALRPVEVLREMQPELIPSRLQRNVVGKISLPAAAVNDRILRPPDMLHRTLHRIAAIEISVGVPDLARMVNILSAGARKNVDFISHRKPDARLSRLEMKTT